MELADTVVILTGASSGIGEAAARWLAAQGAHTVLAARRSERLSALAGELDGAMAVPTDVTVPWQVQRLVAKTLEAFGRVDVLVNAAARQLRVPIAEVAPSDVRAVLELEVVASLVAMQAVLPPMRRQRTGSIVNVSSAASLQGAFDLGSWAAAKAALNAVSEVARQELSPYGINVSVVYPPLDPSADPAAATIGLAIRTGAPHLLVADPPRPITIPSDGRSPPTDVPLEATTG